MKVLNKIFSVIDFLLKAVIVIIVASFIVIIFAQVVARYVFNHSLYWSEELARVLFTQMIFLAAPVAVLEKRHIMVDLVLMYLPRSWNRWLHVAISVICFVFFCSLAYSGYIFVMSNLTQVTAALHIPMRILYGVVPVSSVLMAINCIRSGIDDFCNVYAPEKKEEG